MTLELGTLIISDGTTTVNLLEPSFGYAVASWQPVMSIPKAGGSWVDPQLAEGRQLASYEWGNVTETITLHLITRKVDQAARNIQKLDDLLTKAMDFQARNVENLVPVWMKAQSACETNARYCYIVGAQISGLPDPYGQPIFGPQKDWIGMTDLALTFERGQWQETQPGSQGTCVQLTGQKDYTGADIATFSGSPGQSTDDGFAFEKGTGAIPASQYLILGNDTTNGPTFAGIRFPNCTVPHGATVVDAYIQFRADFSDTGADFVVRIYGEKSGNPGTFTGRVDLMNRPKTTANVVWREGSWTANDDYYTEGLVAIVQEVVDQSSYAAGNAVCMFIVDNGSDSGAIRRPSAWDHPTDPAPILYVTYLTGDATIYGRSATCAAEVYVINHEKKANLTHAYHWTAGPTWSGNLIGTATPFNLLPNPVSDGDILYLGIQSSLLDSGPWCSAVFDIGTPAIYAGATVYSDWEYYDTGAAWSDLDVRDNTGLITDGTQTFSVAGVNSVHWEQPDDWATVAVNGVTCYWVRCVFNITAGSITTPTQQNRDIYTISWPSLDMATIAGDLNALGRLYIRNRSNSRDLIALSDPTLWNNRVMVATRDTARGANFTPYLNLSDEQNEPGVTVTNGTTTTFEDDTTAPTGRSMFYASAALGTFIKRATITLDSSLAQQYVGEFRVFMRYYQPSGGAAGDVGCYLLFKLGTSRYQVRTITRYTDALNKRFAYFDFDKVNTRNPLMNDGEDLDQFAIEVYVASTDTDSDLWMYDIVLMPVDEWITTAEDPSLNFSGDFSGMSPGRYLDLDSVTNFRGTRSMLKDADDDGVSGQWSIDGRVRLKRNITQKFWFWFNRYDGTNWLADPGIAATVQAFRSQRYKWLRGDQ